MTICHSADDLATALRRVDDPVIQQHVSGEEITIDVLGDLSGRVIGAVQRKRLKVRALGLEPLPDAICLTDRWGRPFWKPHPRRYWTILRRLGVKPRSACYVGDNPAKDFLTPNRIGMRTVRVRHPDGLYRNLPDAPGSRPQQCIRAIAQFPGVLADL